MGKLGQVITGVMLWAATAFVGPPALAQAGLPDCTQSSRVFCYAGALPTPASSSAADTRFKEVAVSDLNGDGFPDLYLPQIQPNLTVNDNTDLVYLSKRAASLRPLSSAFLLRPTHMVFAHPGPPLQTTRTYDVEVADLDGDGVPDIIRPDRGSLRVLWGSRSALPNSEGLIEYAIEAVTAVAEFGSDPVNGSVCLLPPNDIRGGNYFNVSLDDPDDPSFFAVSNWERCGESFFVRIGPGRQMNVIRNPALTSRITHGADLGQVAAAAGQLPSQNGIDLLLAHRVQLVDPQDPCRNAADVFPEVHLASAASPLDGLAPNPIGLCDPSFGNRDAGIADLVDLDLDGNTDVYLSILDGVHGAFFHSGDDSRPYPAFNPARRISAIPGIGPLPPNPVFGDITPDLYDARYFDLDQDGQLEIIAVTEARSEIVVVRVSSAFPRLRVVTSEFISASEMHGKTAIAISDFDRDGDFDLVVGGDDEGFPPRSAVHFYENRTALVIQDTNPSSQTIFAGKTLTAGPNVTVIDDVTFQAGREVRLRAGFTARPVLGSEFRAEIVQ